MAMKLKINWRNAVTIVTFFALALLIYFSRHQISETFSRLSELNALYIILIIVLQVFNYHFLTKVYQNLFKVLGTKIDYKPLYKIAMEINFVNNVFPTAGLTGFSYFGIRMKSLGVKAGQSTLVHLLRFIGVFVSFQFLIFFGLLALAIEGKASNLVILVASSVATLLVVGTFVLAYIVGSKDRIDTFFTAITRQINKLLRIIKIGNDETINIRAARTMFLDLHRDYNVIKNNLRSLGPWFWNSLMANVAEITSIYIIYLALGDTVNPGAVIIAYVIANFAGLISVLPGGVGIYEGLMVAVLATMGVSPGLSIPATIMYRVLTSLIQLPPGYYYYQKTINNTNLKEELKSES